MDFSIKAVGDCAVKVQFLQDVTPQLNRKIKIFCNRITELNIGSAVEIVPAYNSVTIYYQPFKITYRDIYNKLKLINIDDSSCKPEKQQLIKVPVVYGGEYGPDLQGVAEYNNLSVKEVIELHQKPDYLIYMLGFLPGFPYLGGLKTKLATPRMENPRRSVSAGSVGIAYKQTGIYPVESPGGWNIIGRTPLRLVNLTNQVHPFLFEAGDLVRFYEVDEVEFLEMEEAAAAGKYNAKLEILNRKGASANDQQANRS
ncbi:5-oxoprolinase subunit PxpB [Virgibacillus oceani]|uniref:Allophanate hydrolase n=1 Tax=Virgibacillus oceani TaxID=1479511 RepID=A0A917H5Z1_9BACI|nr:5-oxoprolinase subunit PxpB [Virgibacillus oceani]GGG67639.1 allophanate hydrolase [Virgibacillus oceani]